MFLVSFIAIQTLSGLALVSLLAVAGGLYIFSLGFQLLGRARTLRNMPRSRVRSAALGQVEVSGTATGPHPIAAPASGRDCFLYRTQAWRRRRGKREWERVAEETMHTPFFIADETGELLIEPFGAELDLHRDFREEYDEPFPGLGLEALPPRVSAFVARHGIASGERLRVEEWTIKPGDPLFVAGTIMENPAIPADGLAGSTLGGRPRNDTSAAGGTPIFSEEPSRPGAGPQVVRLAGGEADAGALPVGQQAKIAAALVRAGITSPAAWSAAGVPYQSGAIEGGTSTDAPNSGPQPARPVSANPDPVPTVVLTKGTNDGLFMLSYRSQKELVEALGWKAAAMIGGGTAIALLGVYALVGQSK